MSVHTIRIFIAALVPIFLAHADDSLNRVKPFLERHCFDCHGPDLQKGDYRFDTLKTDLTDVKTLETWQNILDQLNLGEMPPKKKPRPAIEETTPVIDALTARLKLAYAERKSTGRQTVIRRLNRFELRSTLRDLLYLEGHSDFRPDTVAKLEDRYGNGHATWNSNDPTREFPADEVEEGFDNIGQRLVMSDFLLKLMITAVEQSLIVATHFEEKPKFETKRFAGHIRNQGPNACLESWSREINPGFDAIFQRYREPGASTGAAGRVAPDEVARKGVGASGRYRITIEASALNQRHPWGELIKSKQDEPMLLGLHMADSVRGGLHEGNPTSRKLTQWEMPDDGSKQTYTFETWLEGSWTPWVGWENAPYDRRVQPSHLVEKYLPEAYRPRPKNDAPKEEKQAYEPDMAKALLKAGYKGPHLRIYSMTIEPLIESWPPQSHVFLYGSSDETEVRELILRFAQRAFRTPVKAEEVARYVQLVEAQLKMGLTRPEALRAGYTAVLASPRFYYLQESQGRLNSYEIATRLSYFLWSSMPDEELFALAAADKLNDPAVLGEQVDRLLDDPKAAAFSRHFTERWLRLDKLGSMPPDRSGPFRFYWDRQLEPMMIAQTDVFFADLVKTNGPIHLLIDSDYTFMNERVASLLYGREDVWGDGFRKVSLNDPRRGGIFTQPSVMTASANGVDTSPVIRGVWVLENVLGTPPAPPPPDVEPLAPDLRGATTIREQLEKHRKVPTCNSCHHKIDPMGFAMENFDPVGRWRDIYPDTKLKIDPSSTMSTGGTVEDVVAFKKMLISRKDQVARCLTEKMLTYASGRILEPTDRGQVDDIVEKLKAKGDGLRDLVHLVARSDLFLTK
ncbi:MAG: DUF1592 domain-containing protein [Planctomycetota bacterium]|nr:DUF1592 domain-containing protein [Planctomycetota bacterium]